MDIGAMYIGSYYNTIMICYIKFYTNIATYGPYNGCSSPSNTYSLGNGLAYLKGRCGQKIDSLQLVYYN